LWEVQTFGVLRCAQDDSKNLQQQEQMQQQEQRQQRQNNDKSTALQPPVLRFPDSSPFISDRGLLSKETRQPPQNFLQRLTRFISLLT